MVFPDSPFTEDFNTETLISSNDYKREYVDEEAFKLPQLLHWLCETPRITSFRVNTLVHDIETVKLLLQNELNLVAKRQDKQHIPEIYTHPLLPYVILVECYPKYLLDLDKREKEIIVDPECGAAILRGANIYAPGVIAVQHETKIGDKVSVYVDLLKKCKKGFAKIYECPKKLFVANGVVKMARKELFKNDIIPMGIAIEITDTLSGCPSINASNLPTGSILLQNIPSIICSQVLNPEPGEIVLDMCAAPGNKTSHLGVLMQNQGKIVALDKTPKRVLLLQKTVADFKLNIVDAFCFDATKSCDLLGNKKMFELVPPFLPETFDKILLDAPCSALGNRPQLSNKITNKIANSFVSLQKKLFSNAVHLLKPNGILVYSTCSISLAENEGIVSWALNMYDNLVLDNSEPKLGGPGWPGTKLTHQQLNLVQRFGPEQDTDSIGFFIAKFKKKY